MSIANGQECEGRVALVTGASRGIRRGDRRTARSSPARKVAAVVAPSREPDPQVRRLAVGDGRADTSRGRHGGARAGRHGQGRRPSSNGRRDGRPQLGPIDILVNNAAITYFLPFTEFTEKRYNLMFEVQVRAPFELAQLVLPAMRGRSGMDPQHLVPGRRASAGSAVPASTSRGSRSTAWCKAALDRFSTGLAAELYDDGIAVNSLSPWDNVATPGVSAHDLVDGFALGGHLVDGRSRARAVQRRPQAAYRPVAYSQPLLAELQRRPPVG